MTLKKIEKAITLMKAQVVFLATQQKNKRSINKNIIAYSRVVSKKSLSYKTSEISSTNKFAKTSGSGLTFQVYSHLKNKVTDT